MLGLENYLKNCLRNKDLILSYLNGHVKEIDNDALMEVLRICKEELKKRIEEFEELKQRGEK